jgi:hypothetical protein
VFGLPIGDCRLPIGFFARDQSEIGNSQSAIGKPTRYRVVVLTSSRPENRNAGKLGFVL